MIHNTTTTPAEKLWGIHIPGPDDLFAAPKLLQAVKRLLSWERMGHQLRAEDITFAQQALAEAEVAPQGSQGGTKQ